MMIDTKYVIMLFRRSLLTRNRRRCMLQGKIQVDLLSKKHSILLPLEKKRGNRAQPMIKHKQVKTCL
jgi:hypothetical protein